MFLPSLRVIILPSLEYSSSELKEIVENLCVMYNNLHVNDWVIFQGIPWDYLPQREKSILSSDVLNGSFKNLHLGIFREYKRYIIEITPHVYRYYFLLTFIMSSDKVLQGIEFLSNFINDQIFNVATLDSALNAILKELIKEQKHFNKPLTWMIAKYYDKVIIKGEDIDDESKAGLIENINHILSSRNINFAINSHNIDIFLKELVRRGLIKGINFII